EAEHTQPVIKGDDHRAFFGQRLAIVHRLRAGAGVVTAAINPHHDGPLLAARFSAGPDIEVQAILIGLRTAATRALHACRAELFGFADTVPMCGGLGRAPAQIADRRRRVGNSLVYTDVSA